MSGFFQNYAAAGIFFRGGGRLAAVLTHWKEVRPVENKNQNKNQNANENRNNNQNQNQNQNKNANQNKNCR